MTKAELRKIIGENVKRQRLARKISIEELAEKLGYSTNFVGLMERGRRGVTAHNVYRIAEIFDIEIEALFVDTEKSSSGKSESTLRLYENLREMLPHCDEGELDFIIIVIKALRDLTHTEQNMIKDEDDDDEDHDY